MANTFLPRQPLNNLAPFQMQSSPQGNTDTVVVPVVITQQIVFADGTIQTTAGGGSLPTDIDGGTF